MNILTYHFADKLAGPYPFQGTKPWGLMFPILIKGLINIKSVLCRGYYRYTCHTHMKHLMSWLY